MNSIEQKDAVDYARKIYCNNNVEIDDCAETSKSYVIERPNGAWIQAWVWCPKSMYKDVWTPAIEAASAAFVPLSFEEFSSQYTEHVRSGGDIVLEAELQRSWMLYQRDPQGHFITKVLA